MTTRTTHVQFSRRDNKRRRHLCLEKLEERRVLATFTLTNLDDGPVAAPGDLPGSLRQAIFDCNQASGADEIMWPSGLPGTITLTHGELQITEDLTITGFGVDQTTIDAAGNSRVLNIDDGDHSSQFDVTLSGLTLTGGRTTADFDGGGGIYNWENLTLTESAVSGNATVGLQAHGGGIFNGRVSNLTVTNSMVSENATGGSRAYGGGVGSFGSLTVTSSTIAENRTLGPNGHGGGIASAGNSTVTDSTISGNSTLGNGGSGGGIATRDNSMTVTNSTVFGNFAGGAVSFGGGIISAYGSLSLVGSTISGNGNRGTSNSGGGGIFSEGILMVTDCTIADNSVTGPNAQGGGIFSWYDLHVTITNSTISGNVAGGAGGGINTAHTDAVTIQISTITDNYAPDGYGSGIASFGDATSTRTEVVSSIISGNVNSDVDHVYGNGDNTFQSNGHNLIGTGNAVGEFGAPGDQPGVANPMLGALADNGGPTLTHAVLPGSPALDAGDPSFSPPPDFDQRGDPFARVFSGRIDIGAFEAQPFVVDGDFNDDGLYDCADIDALVAQIAAGTNGLAFDMTGDGLVDLADRDAWLAAAGEINLGPGKVYLLGDATLDGRVDVSDFNAWNANKFSVLTVIPGWCDGNFNADTVVDVLDFNIWNANKFTTSDMPRAAYDTALGMISAEFRESRAGVPEVTMRDRISGEPRATDVTKEYHIASTSVLHRRTMRLDAEEAVRSQRVGLLAVDAVFASLQRRLGVSFESE